MGLLILITHALRTLVQRTQKSEDFKFLIHTVYTYGRRIYTHEMGLRDYIICGGSFRYEGVGS